MKTTSLAVAIAAVLTTTTGFAASVVDTTETLPEAQAGECFAKVVIPAKYETQTVDLEVKQASEKINPFAATFQASTERIQVKEASTKIIPVAATYGTATETIEVRPATKEWKASLKSGAQPASTALLAAAKAAGLNLETTEVGVCYHEHFIPAKYKTETVDVLLSEASETIDVTPAVYAWGEETVLVKEASTKIVAVPATYKTETEKVLVEPEKVVWKKGQDLVDRINTTGEIMCKVKIPAVYKTISKRVVDTAATTKTIEIPAKYVTKKIQKLVTAAQEKRSPIAEKRGTVTKTVLVTEPSFTWHEIHDKTMSGASRTGHQICLAGKPAKYETVTRKIVKTAATTKVIQIPAVFKDVKIQKILQAAGDDRIKIASVSETVQKRVKVADERLEWRRVLCRTNMTSGVVGSIQKALSAAGFDAGAADGQIGRGTLQALDAYQRDKGLNRGGLTYETIKSLGVDVTI